MFSASKLELKTIEEVIDRFKSKICLERYQGALRLKRNHVYYHQVQSQLNITRKKNCYFVVYVNDAIDLYIEEILRNENIWCDDMIPQLTVLYTECIAPEIVRDNLGKGLKCKDPPYVLQAIAKFEAKKKKKTNLREKGLRQT